MTFNYGVYLLNRNIAQVFALSYTSGLQSLTRTEFRRWDASMNEHLRFANENIRVRIGKLQHYT